MVWSFELYIKAAKGEPIEEDGDLQKEIAIWKRGVAADKTGALHRNDVLVYEIYHNGGIEEMFADFEQQHRQFYDMFYSNKFYAYKDNDARHTLKELSEEINKVTSSLTEAGENEVREYNPDEDNFDTIWVGVYLSEYKYNEKKPFGITSQLQVNLKPYHYTVAYGSKILVKKNYDEFLNSEERKNIINDSIKEVFNQIKAISGKR
jgi:hypothetical protein